MTFNTILNSICSFVSCRINKRNSNWHNNAQINSMKSGCFVLLASGMELAYRPCLICDYRRHFQSSWFIGIILGVIVATPFITKVEKRIYMLIASVLILIGGIIYVSAPYTNEALLTARYINGFAMGFTILPYIVHASEIAMPQYRGTCLAFAQCSIASGFTLKIVSKHLFRLNDSDDLWLQGCFIIAFGLFALLCLRHIVESPIFYLRKGENAAALECVEHLQCLDEKTAKHMLTTQKLYIDEQQASCLRGNWSALIKMMFYLATVAFSFAIPLRYFVKNYGYQPYLFAVLHLIGVQCSVLGIDTLGRKLLSMIGLCLMSLFTITIGVNAYHRHIFDTPYIETWIISLLAVIAQFFCGLFAPSSAVYLGEAFSLHGKQYCIALCIIVEQLVHIISISVFVHKESIYCLTIGVLSFIFFILFCLTVPETKNTTMQEAQKRFGKCSNRNCY